MDKVFCALFGEGCAKTMRFHLMGIPVALYGVGYYAVLFFASFLFPEAVFCLVMAGVGIEFTFIWIMVRIRAFCIFCIFNAFAVAGLFFLFIEVGLVWRASTLILATFVSSLYFLYRENAEEFEGGTEESANDIAAEIDGEPILMEDLQQPLAQSIYKLREKIYRLKRDKFDELIKERLFELEAKRKGISKKRLLESILDGKIEVSEKEIERFKRENPDRFSQLEKNSGDLQDRIRKVIR